MAPIPPSRTFPRTSYLPSMALPGLVLIGSPPRAEGFRRSPPLEERCGGLPRLTGSVGRRRRPVRQGPPAAGTAREVGSRDSNITRKGSYLSPPRNAETDV